MYALKTCPACGGTGKRGRGRCRECCTGYRPVPGKLRNYSQVAELRPCPACGGNYRNAKWETWFDCAPAEAVRDIPLQVVRQDRSASWNESFLGLGCLFSVVDYGRAWESSDAEVMERVRDGCDHVQACKIVQVDREAMTLPVVPLLAVIVSRGGYSVRAVFDDLTAVAADAAEELDPQTALAVGTAVYRAGGNGTIAAALARRARS